MKMDPVTVYRLIKALTSARNLVPIVIAAVAVLAVIGIVQPLGEALDDDAAVL